MVEAKDPWLNDIKAKREDALAAFVRAHTAPLVRYLAGMVRNRADAEELAQEAFLRFTSSLDSFRGDCSTKTFLFRIGHNLALNHLASASIQREVLGPEVPDVSHAGPSPHSEASDGEQGQLLRRALRTLPPQQRSVIVLRTWMDMSFREVAEVLSLAEGTVKAHYFFGLKNLRKALEVTHDS